MEKKICNKCGTEKFESDFYLIKKTGKRKGNCSDCDKIYAKAYRENNKEVLRDKNKEHAKKYREANREKAREYAAKYAIENADKIQEYREANKEKAREYALNYREENLEMVNEYQKKYRDENKDKAKKYREDNKKELQEYHKKYREENSDKLKKYQKEYTKINRDNINNRVKERRVEDPLFKLSSNIRCLIKNSIKKCGYVKSKKSEEILGCSMQEFKEYLENQFESWMSWDNNGVYKKGELTWQLDHIIPVSSAKTEKEIIKLNHYTNFRPLESFENLKKSNKLL